MFGWYRRAMSIKYVIASIGLATVLLLSTGSASAQPVDSSQAVTAYGKVTDRGKAVAGVDITAWCGGLDAFGGWDSTDGQGRFEIRTNSKECPLGTHGYLEITRDGNPVGFAYATILTQTMVNVKLEESNLAAVPEFGWIGGAASIMGGGAFILARRRFLQ